MRIKKRKRNNFEIFQIVLELPETLSSLLVYCHFRINHLKCITVVLQQEKYLSLLFWWKWSENFNWIIKKSSFKVNFPIFVEKQLIIWKKLESKCIFGFICMNFLEYSLHRTRAPSGVINVKNKVTRNALKMTLDGKKPTFSVC